MALVRVDIDYIIQGVNDRTESVSYGKPTEGQTMQRLASEWWENDNETLMKVYTVYSDPTLAEVVRDESTMKIRYKHSGVVVASMSIGRK